MNTAEKLGFLHEDVTNLHDEIQSTTLVAKAEARDYFLRMTTFMGQLVELMSELTTELTAELSHPPVSEDEDSPT